MVNCRSMNYVFAERLTVLDVEHAEDAVAIGTEMITLYLELDPNAPVSERRVIPLVQAAQLRDDLTRLLEQS